MSDFYSEDDTINRLRREAELDVEIEEDKDNTCILLIHVDHMFTSADKLWFYKRLY